MLSLEELGKSNSSIAVEEGKNIDYFDDYKNRECLMNGKSETWMLRSPVTTSGSLVFIYTYNNKLSMQNAFDSAGVRPAFCIDSSTKIVYEKYSGGERFVVK